METLRTLVVGVGRQGERHVEAQLAQKASVIFYDTSEKQALNIRQRFPNAEYCTDLTKAILGSDLVIVSTPDHLHTDVASQAVVSGKAVLCEKPLTTSLEEAERLQRLVHEHNTTFIVANNMRVVPAFMEARNRLRSGQIGKPLSIYTSYKHDVREQQQRSAWRLGETLLYGGGSHAVDLLCWVMNEPIVAVQGLIGTKTIQGFNNPEDYRVNVMFRSGTAGHLWISGRVVLPNNGGIDLSVFGDRGTLTASNNYGILRSYSEGQPSGEFIGEILDNPFTVPLVTKIVNDYLLRRSGSFEPLPDINEAVRGMRVLSAIERAIHSGTTEIVA